MAGNTLLTIQDLSDRAAAILQAFVELPNLVQREDAAFTRKIGETYQMRMPERVVNTTGRVAERQAVEQTKVDLVIDQQIHQAWDYSVQELSLSMEHYQDLILMPRIEQIAGSMEADLGGLYLDIYDSAGTPGTTPNSFALFQQPSTLLNRFGAPRNNRWMVVNSDGAAGLAEVLHDLPTVQQKMAADALTEGLITTPYDYTRGVRISHGVRMHTNGAWGDSTPLMDGSTADGATQVVTNGWESGQATVNRGDVFTIAGVYSVHPVTRESTGKLQHFVCTEQVSDTTGDMTIKVKPTIRASGRYQNVTAVPANDAALTFLGVASGVYPQNLAGRPDAIALAMVQQQKPKSALEFARSDYKGLRIAMMAGLDVINHSETVRADVIYGRALYNRTIVRFWG
jgi:hypothetical protein